MPGSGHPQAPAAGQSGMVNSPISASEQGSDSVGLDACYLEDGLAILPKLDLLGQLRQLSRALLHLRLEVIDGDTEPSEAHLMHTVHWGAFQCVIELQAGLWRQLFPQRPDGEQIEEVRHGISRTGRAPRL